MSYLVIFDNDLKKVIENISIKKNTDGELYLDENGEDVTTKYLRQDGTAARVLKRDADYIITSALANKIYLLYSNSNLFDIESIKNNNTAKDFLDKIILQKPIKEDFWIDSFWQLDDSNKVLRKEGEKRMAVAGEYYRKQFQLDPNAIDDVYLKVNLMYSSSSFNVVGDSVDSFYSWIYGKFPLLDNYLFRIYFSFEKNESVLIEFLNVIQSNFDSNQIPFSFKFLTVPELYHRADTGVLYLSRRHYHISIDIINEIYSQFKSKNSFFRKISPLFTYKIDDGISLAENIDDSRYSSFGSYASVTLAKAIIQSIKGKGNNNNIDASNIKQILTNKLISQFYKNPKSQYFYNIDFLRHKKATKTFIKLPDGIEVKNEWLIDSKQNNKKRYLFTSIKIANKICKEAIWTKGYCNWISCNGNIERKTTNGKFQVVGYKYELLNDEFINGRVGVAFFLALMYDYYNDETYKITANAAIKFLNNKIENNEIKPNKGQIFALQKISLILDKKERKFSTQDINKLSFRTVFPLNNSTKISIAVINSISEGKWRDKILYNITTATSVGYDEIKTADSIIQNFFEQDRPYGNFLGNDEFNPTIIGGYAMLGYFFLRLYDTKNIPLLPIQIESEPQSDNQVRYQVLSISS